MLPLRALASSLIVAAAALLASAPRAASAQESRHQTRHCGHCVWVPGHYDVTYEWRTVERVVPRQVLAGYTRQLQRVPDTREEYDPVHDVYVRRTTYTERWVEVPVYRTEYVREYVRECVPVRRWVPGYWVCHHGYPPPPPPPYPYPTPDPEPCPCPWHPHPGCDHPQHPCRHGG